MIFLLLVLSLASFNAEVGEETLEDAIGQANSRLWPDSPSLEIHSARSEVIYHGNTDSKIFHKPACRYYDCKKCSKKFSSREDAVKAGYRPCKTGKPLSGKDRPKAAILLTEVFRGRILRSRRFRTDPSPAPRRQAIAGPFQEFPRLVFIGESLRYFDQVYLGLSSI